MAKKRDKPGRKTTDKQHETDLELISEHKECFKRCADSWRKQRQDASDDLKFFMGDTQWPADIRAQREAEGLPCLVINRLPQFVATVVGDQRQNRPSIKVSPVDSGADKQRAEIFEGLARNIEYISMADVAYDRAFEFPVICGHRGFLRIVTRYCGDDTFDQELVIKQVINPFTVFFDPNCLEPDYSDAQFCYIVDDIPEERFEDEYGEDCEATSWDDVSNMDGNRDHTIEVVRVVEAYYKEPVKRVIVQLIDGRVVDRDDLEKIQEEDPFAIVALDADGKEIERTVDSHKVMWVKMTGSKILDGPREYVKGATYIPVVPVAGNELNVEGELRQWGLVRFARDPQQAYNFTRSKEIEGIALSTKAPWLLSAKMVAGYEDMWKQANIRALPYLLYNTDSSLAGAKPDRIAPPPPSSAITTSSLQSVDEIKSVVGIYDSSLGKQTRETSGVAIQARQRESDTATFTYLDNLTRALRLVGKILIDLIPLVYDSERIVRVLGLDGAERQVTINQQIGDLVLNDLSVGKYDVAVSVGPSYATQRIEAANSMIEFMRAFPNAAPLMGDLIAGSMDWPKAEEIAERLKAALPPQIANAGNPEALQQMQAQQQEQQQNQGPDPKLMAEKMESAAQMASSQATIAKAKMELQGKELELRTKHAEAIHKLGQMTAELPMQQPVMPDQQNAMAQGITPPVGQYAGYNTP
jgi:hypothetical protein